MERLDYMWNVCGANLSPLNNNVEKTQIRWQLPAVQKKKN
jgi:hypothetical protein